jgi:hypothetical protein
MNERVAPAPFVCCLISDDSGRTPAEIVVHKEAERKTGGDFWWGLRARLGPQVASLATMTPLPVLFLKTDPSRKPDPDKRVRVWNRWRSIAAGQAGKIPKHALVLSDVADPKDRRGAEYYALVCKSNDPLALGDSGSFDLSDCRTTKNHTLQFLQGAALLMALTPSILEAPAHSPGAIRRVSKTVKGVTLRVTLLAPWYVRLMDDRVFTVDEMARLRDYKDGDDWLALVKSLRPNVS